MAAEERRAFLLPHCRYVCVQSSLIALDYTYTSALFTCTARRCRILESTTRDSIVSSYALTETLHASALVHAKASYDKSKHALSQYGLIVCPYKHPLSYSAHDGGCPGAFQPKRYIASWTWSIPAVWLSECNCRSLTCKDAHMQGHPGMSGPPLLLFGSL